MTETLVEENDQLAVAEAFAFASGQCSEEMAFRVACEALQARRSDLEFTEIAFCVAEILSTSKFRPLTESTIVNLPSHQC